MIDTETVIEILKKHSGKSEISMSDLLVQDLGINGDDADELYCELLDDHKIDLKKINGIEDCFHSEGELIDIFYALKYLAYKIGLTEKPARRKLKPIQVSEIVEFCIT